MSELPNPVQERIVLLDTLRGFGVLGILLMNVLGFAMLSPAYSFAGFDVDPAGGLDRLVWMFVELFGEGSMRGMFSLLFGAGLVLFTGDRGKGAAIHYRRMFFLLLFGLFDAYVLLWFGDILIAYAICGALLYPLRNWRPRRLIMLALVIGLLSSLSYAFMNFVLSFSRDAALQVAASSDPSSLEPMILESAAGWEDFKGDYLMSAEALAEELAARSGSYGSAFAWNVEQTNGMLLFVLPLFLLWDALMMMLLGMALFKLGVLNGSMKRSTALRMAVVGLGLGVLVNGWEIQRSLASNLDIITVFAQFNVTYHLGRGAMALGYLGLLAWILDRGLLQGLMTRLAAVGRMALSNYLMHSCIALLLFTGAGLGLVGALDRAQLYLVVVAIWGLQLALSPWWLRSHRYGPLEYLWRRMTYGHTPT